jgi:hypothetical protein
MYWHFAEAAVFVAAVEVGLAAVEVDAVELASEQVGFAVGLVAMEVAWPQLLRTIPNKVRRKISSFYIG